MPPTRSGPVPGASPPTRGHGRPPAQRRQAWSPRSERRKTKPRFLSVLLHAALFFGVLSAVTTLGAFVPGAVRARVWVGLPLGLALISLVAWNATILSRERDVELGLALGAFLVALALRLAMRRWSWLGAQLFAAATLASIAYLLYAASITFVVGREPFYLITSTLLLVLEVAALTLSLSYLFEIVDTTSRTSDRPHPVDSNYLPRVAIQ